MKYQCEGCSATFEGSPEEAFEEGWDTPEQFMSHCTCPKCAIVKTAWWQLIVLKQPLTDEQIQMIQEYNRIYDEYNKEKS